MPAVSVGSVPSFFRLASPSQLSTLEPPLLAITSPTGTPRASVSVLAKKYPAALASPTVEGAHCSHPHCASSSLVMLMTLGILTKRMSESARAPATTSL